MKGNMYKETREPHSTDCECDHCIYDRRQTRALDLHEQMLEIGREQNRILSRIVDELRAVLIGLRTGKPF